MPFAVCVTLTLNPGSAGAFMPLMQENARASLSSESGCLRFDVLSDPDRPDDVFLYELYADADAFQVHLATEHFRSFDAATASMIADKDVKTFQEVMS